MRRLVSLRRTVPGHRRDAYDRLWSEVRRLAEERGAHAWRFVSADRPEEHLEFLEHRLEADPRRDTDFHAALRRLEDIGAARVEEWDERQP